jgi:hypothetical protein
VLLHVANVDKAAQFYQILYGPPSLREPSPQRVWFQIGDTRLGLEQAAAGQKPHIDHFGVKVTRFDTAAVTAGLVKLGADVLRTPGELGALRFRDPLGITVELAMGER